MKDFVFGINGKLDVLYENEIYKSIIQDQTGGFIAINVPLKDGRYLTSVVGDKLEIIYYEELNVYKFESKVIGRRVENNIPQLIIEIPNKIMKIQRRKFVRVGVIYYLQYAKAENSYSSPDIEDKLNKDKASRGLMLDLSGGGLRLKVYDKVNIGDTIIADIPADDEKIRVKGKVVRIEKDRDGDEICGIAFTEIDNRTQEKIIRYIFTVMRKRRKTV